MGVNSVSARNIKIASLLETECSWEKVKRGLERKLGKGLDKIAF